MGDFTLFESLALAGLPLSGVVSGIIATMFTSARNVYINSITVERNKWIDKLRVNIASYSTSLSNVVFTLVDKKGLTIEKAIGAVRVLNEKASVIQLQLNPRGLIDKNILSLIEAITVFTDTEYMLIDQADKLLIAHSQWLLKAEWERVKYEAHNWIYRTWHHGDYQRFINDEYLPWAKGDGTITQTIQDFADLRVKRKQMLGVPEPTGRRPNNGPL